MQNLSDSGFDVDDWDAVFDRYDKLVRDCVDGSISFERFHVEYENFYMLYALDGHEASSQSERDELARLEDRIAPHRAIWESILSAGLSTGFASDPDTYRKHGFFGDEEAFMRLLNLVRNYPRLAGTSLEKQ